MEFRDGMEMWAQGGMEIKWNGNGILWNGFEIICNGSGMLEWD